MTAHAPLLYPTTHHSGALLERVQSRAYSERYIAALIQSILRFIAQCHTKGIVYRDVKPGGWSSMTSGTRHLWPGPCCHACLPLGNHKRVIAFALTLG